MQNYSGTVVSVLATQFADQVVPTSEEEAGKAQLTRAAAWAIHQQDPSVGLCSKLTGNQVHGLSVDTIVDRTGSLVDIATSKPEAAGMVRILPGWFTYPLNPDDAQKWTQPTAALAALPGPMPKTDAAPGPGPQPPASSSSNAEVLAKLDQVLANQSRAEEVQARDTAAIIARSDLNTERIQQQLHQIVEDFEATAKKVLALWLAQREQRPPVEGGGGGGEGEPPNELLLLLLKKYLENRPQAA